MSMDFVSFVILEFCKKFDVKRWDVQGGIEKKGGGIKKANPYLNISTGVIIYLILLFESYYSFKFFPAKKSITDKF